MVMVPVSGRAPRALPQTLSIADLPPPAPRLGRPPPGHEPHRLRDLHRDLLLQEVAGFGTGHPRPGQEPLDPGPDPAQNTIPATPDDGDGAREALQQGLGPRDTAHRGVRAGARDQTVRGTRG